MNKKKESKNSIQLATNILKKGGIVSIMAETVYGLAVDSSNSNAIKTLFKLKKRPKYNPLIIHVNTIEMAENLSFFTNDAKKLADEFWPGPLTIILKKKNTKIISNNATAGLKTIAIRMPNSKVFLEIIKKLNRPLAAPSANESGYISSTNGFHVSDSFGDKVDLIIDSGKSKHGLESTIINLTSEPYKIERLGVISKNKIKKRTKFKIIENKEINSKKIVSPGQLKKHYSPKTPIRLNAKKPLKDEAYLSFGKNDLAGSSPSLNLSPSANLEEAAFNLFDFLRKLDKLNKNRIAITSIPNKGIGKTINERLRRASHHE